MEETTPPSALPEKEESPDPDDDDDQDVSLLEALSSLSPHTSRLLKLVQFGTADYAAQATDQLATWAQTASPLPLWRVLGCLLEALIADSWKTRIQASRAMQAVASHIPNHADFWNQQLPLMLEMQSLDLEVVLDKGRLLYAYADDDESLDNETETETPSVQARIAQQRQILAERLGLAKIAAIVSIKGNTLITQEDLDVPSKPAKRPRPAPTQSASATTTITDLLIAEMNRASRSETHPSHSSPQLLLASQLIYWLLDPVWIRRHGAIVGLQALVRAWRFDDDDDDDGCGWWSAVAHDLMTRCMAVLALDRFGDYSGVVQSFGGGGVIAVVRQAVAQLLALLWIQAPLNIQKATIDKLRYLAMHHEWEVRQGAHGGFQFIVSIAYNDGDVAMSVDRTVGRIESRQALECVVPTVVAALSDISDDVQSAAARCLQEFVMYRPELFNQIVTPLWSALEKSKPQASCLIDLVSVLSILVEQDCHRLLQRLGQKKQTAILSVSELLTRLLNSDFGSVQESALRCLAKLAKPLARNLSRVDDQPNQGVAALTAFQSLVLHAFDLYFGDGAWSRISERNQGTSYATIRDETWQELSEACTVAFRAFLYQDTETKLLLTFLGIECCDRKHRYDRFPLQVESAEALAGWIVRRNPSELSPVLHYVILCSLRCPWIGQMESSCLLVRALALKAPSYDIVPSDVKALLNDMIQGKAPICLMVQNLDTVDGMLMDPETVRAFDQAFLRGLEQVAKWNRSSFAASNATCDVWMILLRSNGFTSLPTVAFAPSRDTMRINATIAGLVLELVVLDKVTPLVRALMTSMKNETECDVFVGPWELHRLGRTCHYILSFIDSSACRTRFETAWKKVIESLCATAIDSSNEVQGVNPGAWIVQRYVSRAMAAETLQMVPSVWPRVMLLLETDIANRSDDIADTLLLLQVIGRGAPTVSRFLNSEIGRNLLSAIVSLACTSSCSSVRSSALGAMKVLCSHAAGSTLQQVLQSIMPYLRDQQSDVRRLNACSILQALVSEVGTEIRAFVRGLLPLAMGLMTDQDVHVARSANKVFSDLVLMAPLVVKDRSVSLSRQDSYGESVVDHLILGKPLPPVTMPSILTNALVEAGICLRAYQREGVAWLSFLHDVRLNGALCDDMGLGKTLQALIAVALAHLDHSGVLDSRKTSLIVCPTSLVGHWMSEIKRVFNRDSLFHTICIGGRFSQRKELWRGLSSATTNLVVTSYTHLRSDIDLWSHCDWEYCVLDEGHLLKNPTTATAKASRRLRARHKVILTGTPVQNNVHELWSVFDFLMPNFLGDSSEFARDFARPISKGQSPGATAVVVGVGMDKLKTLHQQVLPFILRREKCQVLKELPPKIVSTIRVPMTELQAKLYSSFCRSPLAQASLDKLRGILKANGGNVQGGPTFGTDVLKSLLFLRLLCTHPSLVLDKDIVTYRLSSSAKLTALADLLQYAGICEERVSGVDDDTSFIYCNGDDDSIQDSYSDLVNSSTDVGLRTESASISTSVKRKCVIFAQFTRSLDVVEELVLKSHMPLLRYVRLDGRTPTENRSSVVERFNRDPTVKVLLATTRVGGLGLNLSGADTVVFLENDFNPFVDLQAMDRLHRLGQTESVNVYNLVTEDSIEEKIIEVQKRKMAVSEAIVNGENSTMFSMGTDRLLDIFAFRGSQCETQEPHPSSLDLDAVVERCHEDYATLSMEGFLSELRA